MKLKHLSIGFEYFTPTLLIFGLIQFGFIAYSFIQYMNYQCANVYTNVSSNMEITNIFPISRAFFSQNFYYFNPKIAIFGPILLCIISNIVSLIINYQYAKFHAFVKKLTIDVISVGYNGISCACKLPPTFSL